MLVVEVSNYIKVKGLSNRQIDSLAKLFTFNNPKFYKLKNAGIKISERARFIKTYFVRNKYFFLPRGGFLKLKEFLLDNKISYVLRDYRFDSGNIYIDLKFKKKLRDYQKHALKQMVKKSQNILESPPGSGKTIIALALIKVIKKNTLIIVNKVDLAQQWLNRIKETLDYDAGLIGSGVYNVKNITVSTIQTLDKLNKKEFARLNHYFSCVICDEVHHFPAPIMYRVLNKIKAKYRYGFTATLKRKDQLEFLVFLALGFNVVKITDEHLIDEGYFIPLTVKLLNSYSVKKNSKNWNEVISLLTTDKLRNELIIRHIKKEIEKNRKVLILTNRVEHCKFLASKLKCKFIVGSIKKDERLMILNFFKTHENILVSTFSLLGEGLDFPEVQTLFLVVPSNNFGLLKQLTGRIRRRNSSEDKNGIIYDIVDMNVPLCKKMANNRKRFYKKMNIKVELQRNFEKL